MIDDAISAVIAELWPEFPDLLGDEWEAFQRALLPLLRQLDADTGADADTGPTVDRILAQFAEHPEVYQRLVSAIAATSETPTRSGTRVLSPLFEQRERQVVVPVFFGTCRDDTGRADPAERFGTGRGPGSFGIGWVSIPDDHRMGEIEKPPWWRVIFGKPRPGKHVVIDDLSVLDRDAFVAAAGRAAADAAVPEGLTFVHGYNVPFAAGLERAAQIAYDLGFQGVPLFYSWPSNGTAGGYTKDENQVRWSEANYRDFVGLCRTRLALRRLHIVAHSMGGRLVAETLADVTATGDGDDAPVHTVVFAAPDIDADTFRQLAAEFGGCSGTCALYASSDDWALKASAAIHGRYRRAGDSDGGILIARGVQSIDAHAVDTGLLGHSYIGDNRSILSDVFYLLQGLKPSQRASLHEYDTERGRYWACAP